MWDFPPAMKDHPDSPIKSSEVKLDETARAYVVRDGVKFRIKTRVVEVSPRKFARITEISHPV